MAPDVFWNRRQAPSATIKEGAKLVIVNRDITERKRAEAQLEHNLFHDPLTGLPNRRMFLDRLQNFVQARRDAAKPHTLLLTNVDRFKVFNETMGHRSRRPDPAGNRPPARIALTAGPHNHPP
jgi:PleD family two-component response regulator